MSKAFCDEIKSIYTANSNAENAAKMAAYMKGHFRFYGIKSPVRKQLSKEFLRIPFENAEELLEAVDQLWKQEERELHYFAMELLHRHRKLLSLDSMPFLESLVVRHSWWDSVDYLAATNIGLLIKRYPEHQSSIVRPWISSPNLWLNRTAIIHQLKYKDEVDVDLLTEAILPHAASKEFFHAKAIGWALRQYSKFNAPWVRDFIDGHELRPLSVREGRKYL